MNDSLLTDHEVRLLAQALRSTRRGLPVPDDVFQAEVAHIVGWAERVRIDMAILDPLLHGEVGAAIREGELRFVAIECLDGEGA